jgi:hypothetical protein
MPGPAPPAVLADEAITCLICHQIVVIEDIAEHSDTCLFQSQASNTSKPTHGFHQGASPSVNASQPRGPAFRFTTEQTAGIAALAVAYGDKTVTLAARAALATKLALPIPTAEGARLIGDRVRKMRKAWKDKAEAEGLITLLTEQGRPPVISLAERVQIERAVINEHKSYLTTAENYGQRVSALAEEVDLPVELMDLYIRRRAGAISRSINKHGTGHDPAKYLTGNWNVASVGVSRAAVSRTAEKKRINGNYQIRDLFCDEATNTGTPLPYKSVSFNHTEEDSYDIAVNIDFIDLGDTSPVWNHTPPLPHKEIPVRWEDLAVTHPTEVDVISQVMALPGAVSTRSHAAALRDFPTVLRSLPASPRVGLPTQRPLFEGGIPRLRGKLHVI